jgi:predicted dehydrogenase
MPQISANDKVQIALIGAGGMGQGDTRYSLVTGETKLVAAADIYDGRLTRMKEQYGNDLYTTRDYREVLARKDVDAVIVATPDHWHSRITVDALEAGKDVYCEKPMIQRIEEGRSVIAAQQKTGRMLQIGSQYVSSLVYQKAKELLKGGTIGEVNLVEAWLDRNSAIGAWQYSIPPDASPSTVDWDRFLGHAPKRPFEPVRLFRWRNYDDYGTGVAGDLFVHLLSGLHFAIGSSGPTRVYGTGGVRFWKDGRDAPDVVLALLDYPKTPEHPEFTLSLKVNFASGSSEESFGVKFVGSEGIMVAGMSELTVSRTPRETEPGLTIDTFPKSLQERITADYRAKYPRPAPSADAIRPNEKDRFVVPRGVSANVEHHRSFLRAVRSRKLPYEDAVFGMRAAGPALLCNVSLKEGKPLVWDAAGMARKT